MMTVQQKAQSVLWVVEFKSVVTVQRTFRCVYGGVPPHANSIRRCYAQFQENGSFDVKKYPGCPRTSDETVERIRRSCVRSSKKSIAKRSLQIGVPKSIIQNVFHKRLCLRAYKLQFRHHIKPTERPKRVHFATDMLNKIDDDERFLQRVLFTDEATFHANRNNCKIWGSQQSNEIVEYDRGSPNVNVWCGLMHEQFIGPFFFIEQTITVHVYLDMLEQYVFPQVDQIEEENNVTFQQDGAPPRFSLEVRDALHARFSDRWIGRSGPIQ